MIQKNIRGRKEKKKTKRLTISDKWNQTFSKMFLNSGLWVIATNIVNCFDIFWLI
uniref:Uncharacterized protein n=1 Tax=Rhizophora mucronata TaxID=61149 RepID=A0A2P2QC72_RHIMU